MVEKAIRRGGKNMDATKTVFTKIDLEGLEHAGIIEAKGYSGKPTTIDTALQLIPICQIHASNGAVYEIKPLGDMVIGGEMSECYQLEEAV